MTDRDTLATLYGVLQASGDEADATVAATFRDAAAADPAAFAAMLATVPIDDGCALFEVYEALFADEATHAPLLEAEFARLFALAERDPRRGVFSQLVAIGLARTPDLVTAIDRMLARALQSADAHVRRFAADHAADLLPTAAGKLETKLEALAAGDPDWRVRVLARRSLAGRIPAARHVPPARWADRVRTLIAAGRLHDPAA